MHKEGKSGYETFGTPALLSNIFNFEARLLPAFYDDPMGANESARQAGSNDTGLDH